MIVRTAAGLEALAAGTVVLDADGDAWQKDETESCWWGYIGHTKATALEPERIVKFGPFRTMRVADE